MIKRTHRCYYPDLWILSRGPAGGCSVWEGLHELYRYRALIQTLVSRELKARYRGSVLGFLWSLLNPLLLMLVYWLVFSVYMRNPMEHYHVFLFCGLLPWIWFSSSLLEGCNSIISGASLVKKVLFPAEVLPVVAILSNLIHFFLALPILIGFLLLSGVLPGWNLIFFPCVIVIQLLFTLSLVLLLSALSVHYRDIQQILGNLITLWFFMSPVIYPVFQIPDKARKFVMILKCNPITHLMVAYQRMFLQKMSDHGAYPFDLPLPWKGLTAVFVLAIIVLFFSYRIFNHFKVSFSEEI